MDGFSGASVVMRDGHVVSERASGLADDDLPWTVGTPSQVASISKQFAAAVALRLVDAGMLALDTTVGEVLDGAPPRWDEVTVRHLATHTAGVPHWDSARPGLDPEQDLPARERLRLLLGTPLLEAPGRTWRYSSPGYVILGAVLAASAGRAYDDLVRGFLLAPLGLRATATGAPAGPGCAAGRHGAARVPAWDLHTMPGTGDVWSTAPDLARFVTALHGGDLLPGAVRAGLHESVPTGQPDRGGAIATTRYALGHFVGTVRGLPAAVLPGDNPGYLSLAVWLPQSRTAAVVLCNDETQDIEAEIVDVLDEAGALA